MAQSVYHAHGQRLEMGLSILDKSINASRLWNFLNDMYKNYNGYE